MTGDSFVLAASSEMLFVDLPKPERIRRLHDAGFAVEIWDWRGHDIDVLERLAGEGVVFTSMTGYTEGVYVLENLNTAVDHPGTPFARAADTLDLVRGIDSPHLKLNLDLYHAQIGEGNLIDLCREALPWIGEIQPPKENHALPAARPHPRPARGTEPALGHPRHGMDCGKVHNSFAPQHNSAGVCRWLTLPGERGPVRGAGGCAHGIREL